jgi:hypothetical protein
MMLLEFYKGGLNLSTGFGPETMGIYEAVAPVFSALVSVEAGRHAKAEFRYRMTCFVSWGDDCHIPLERAMARLGYAPHHRRYTLFAQIDHVRQRLVPELRDHFDLFLAEYLPYPHECSARSFGGTFCSGNVRRLRLTGQ